MLLIILALIGVVIGLTSNKIKKLEIKQKDLLYDILGLQIGFRLLGLIFTIEDLNKVLSLVQIMTFVLVLMFMFYNRKQLSVLIVGVGTLLNLIVMIFNSGKMPVLTDMSVTDLRHSVMTGESKLKILGDIIDLPYPLSIGMAKSSIGDIIIFVGLMFIVAQLVGKEKI